jgi:hypothetical protein
MYICEYYRSQQSLPSARTLQGQYLLANLGIASARSQKIAAFCLVCGSVHELAGLIFHIKDDVSEVQRHLGGASC